MRRVRLATLVLAVLVAMLASGPIAVPSTASATCSLQANTSFESWSAETGSGIASVFEGRVRRVRGPAWAPQYLVRVERLVAGVRMPRFVRFSGEQICSSITLDRGARYLFAMDPTRMDAEGSMVFWRAGGEWVGGSWTFDGDGLPRDDRALLTRFRESLPPLRSRLAGERQPLSPIRRHLLPGSTPRPCGSSTSRTRTSARRRSRSGSPVSTVLPPDYSSRSPRSRPWLPTARSSRPSRRRATRRGSRSSGRTERSSKSVPGPLVPMTFDSNGTGALVSSWLPSGQVRLVRVGLEDGSVTQLVAPTWEYPGPAFVSPDGRWLAWRAYGGDELRSLLRYRGPDRRVRSLGQGEPIGFDALGRLWHTASDSRYHLRLARTDPATGRTTLLRHLGLAGPHPAGHP